MLVEALGSEGAGKTPSRSHQTRERHAIAPWSGTTRGSMKEDEKAIACSKRED